MLKIYLKNCEGNFKKSSFRKGGMYDIQCYPGNLFLSYNEEDISLYFNTK